VLADKRAHGQSVLADKACSRTLPGVRYVNKLTF
jgi:hypothetical protein